LTVIMPVEKPVPNKREECMQYSQNRPSRVGYIIQAARRFRLTPLHTLWF
jgi:hypothetical protein